MSINLKWRTLQRKRKKISEYIYFSASMINFRKSNESVKWKTTKLWIKVLWQKILPKQTELFIPSELNLTSSQRHELRGCKALHLLSPWSNIKSKEINNNSIEHTISYLNVDSELKRNMETGKTNTVLVGIMQMVSLTTMQLIRKKFALHFYSKIMYMAYN